MSKIGKMPIELKEGITVSVDNGIVNVKGVKGDSSFEIPYGIEVKKEENKLIVYKRDLSDKVNKRAGKNLNSLYGLTRASIANMIAGVSTGFEKQLELSGVGYRAQTSGTELTLSLGFSHPVKVKAPQGITFKIAENVITVSGADKTLVGETAAKIRSIRPPEPYKGKGISYKGERIRRKAGKAAKAVGGK